MKPSILLLFAALLPDTMTAEWKAGFAKTNITPDYSIWLAGYGARTKPSEGVLQPIYVKSLALQDETGAVSVLVTSDLLGFSRDMAAFVAREAQSKLGISRNRLALNSSHTHSAPVTDKVLRPAYPYDDAQQAVIDKYTANLLVQIVSTIGAAIKDLSPATIQFEQGLAGFAVNRRRVGRRDRPGPVDHDVPVLRINSPDGKLRGIVFGYACHATTLSLDQINGDWPGYAQEELERAHPGAMALFVTGAGADANPLPRGTVELARAYGKTLATAIDLVLTAKMRPVNGPLRSVFDTVDLPFQTAPTREELQERLKDNRLERHARFLLGKLERDGKLPDRYPYPVQVWQFGSDLTWILLGGELVVDYSLRLKKQYGWDDVWVSGYSNDVMAYIPSLRVLKEGGYEGGGAMIPYGQPASFRAAVEEIVIEKVEEQIAKVKPAASTGRAAVRSVDTGPLPGSAGAVAVASASLAHTSQLLPVDAAGRIVKPANAEVQVNRVFSNLEKVLGKAGSDFSKLVKLNFYVTGDNVTPIISRALEKRFPAAELRPAVSLVVTQFLQHDAMVALDAIAITDKTDMRSPDISILPPGPRAYISGQASPGELREATTNTLKTLDSNLEFLGLTRADVVQAKAFLQPMSSAGVVDEEIRAFFGKDTPPVVFVEWISKTPVEIELVVKSRVSEDRPSIEFLTPPNEKANRVFTRIVRIQSPEVIYISGMYGPKGADGASQTTGIFDSLKTLLGRLDSDLRHMVKATYYVADDTTSRLLNELRPRYLEEGRAPAASKAMVAGTGFAGRTITLDMIAIPHAR
jgi:neutral ceramidase